jgi:DNA polymerase-4
MGSPQPTVATGDPAAPPRVIVHLDLDAFFAAVEVLENPALADKPVVVGGRPQERGVVSAASYPARVFGVRSAMPTAQALRLCPQAVLLPPRHALYQQYSRRVMAILREVTPLVEQVSIDEAYLDLTERVGAWDEGIELARALQRRVREEVGLSASLGVATNKLVAKVASDRHKPGGLTVVRPGEECAFLAPLSVRVLWGVGPRTAERLAGLGVETVGQLAALPEQSLVATFGRHGLELARQARGLDERPLVTARERKSYSQEHTFRSDISDVREASRHLWRMSQRVAEALKREDRVAGTVALKLRTADFTTFTRQMRLTAPTNDARTLYLAALALLRRGWPRRQALRLLGVAARDLTVPAGQLSFLEDARFT